MSDEHDITVSRGVAVVTLHGELDAHDAPRLRELFAGALDVVSEAPSPRRLVLDLAAVQFLDSTALGTMIGALRRAREAGGEVVFVLPRTPASRIFEITGLDQVLDTRTSRDAAMEP
jgi:anti-sigma B factor antagonist